MVIILNFLFKTAGNINHGYSPLKIFCRRSCHFFLFMGEKYSYHIRFVCAKRLGWWTLVITWKVLQPRPQLPMIDMHDEPTGVYPITTVFILSF
jgi:hypothetical protein